MLQDICVFSGNLCGQPGEYNQCAPVTKCLSAINDLRKGIRPMLCGFEGPQPIVCCNLDYKPDLDEIHPFMNITRKPVTKSIFYNRLLEIK